jgi:hypothetical protein
MFSLFTYLGLLISWHPTDGMGLSEGTIGKGASTLGLGVGSLEGLLVGVGVGVGVGVFERSIGPFTLMI